MLEQLAFRTLLIAITVCALCFGLSLFVPKSKMIVPSEEARELASTFGYKFQTKEETESAVARVFDSNLAMVYLNHSWSGLSEYGKYQFAQFILDSIAMNPQIEHRNLDLTALAQDYSVLMKLPGWSALQSKSRRPLVRGMGEIAWVDSGRVIHVQPISDFQSSRDLYRTTNKLFSTCEITIR